MSKPRQARRRRHKHNGDQGQSSLESVPFDLDKALQEQRDRASVTTKQQTLHVMTTASPRLKGLVFDEGSQKYFPLGHMKKKKRADKEEAALSAAAAAVLTKKAMSSGPAYFLLQRERNGALGQRVYNGVVSAILSRQAEKRLRDHTTRGGDPQGDTGCGSGSDYPPGGGTGGYHYPQAGSGSGDYVCAESLLRQLRRKK